MKKWCRYCGSTSTCRWRPSPWGKDQLCNAHWIKWHNDKLDLNLMEEPTSPICRKHNNEFLYQQRKKRKRSDSSVEDHIEEKITFLFYVRKKIKQIEDQENALKTALQPNFVGSLHEREARLKEWKEDYEEELKLKSEGRFQSLEKMIDELEKTEIPCVPMNLFEEYRQLETIVMELLENGFSLQKSASYISGKQSIISNLICEKTNKTLSSAIHAIDMEIQQTKNQLFLWWKDHSIVLEHHLKQIEDYSHEHERFVKWKQEQLNHFQEVRDIITTRWSEEQVQLPRGYGDLSEVLKENKALNLEGIQSIIKPCTMWAFEKLEGGVYRYGSEEKRVVVFEDLNRLQQVAHFYDKTSFLSQMQKVDFIFVYKTVGYMVCPYQRCVPLKQALTRDRNGIWQQLFQSVISLHKKGMIHKNLCFENVWIQENDHLLIRNEELQSPEFAPPLEENQVIGSEDIWALGVFLYYLHHDKYPLLLEGMSHVSFYLNNLSVSKLGEQLLQRDPDKRWTITDKQDEDHYCENDTLKRLQQNNEISSQSVLLSFVMDYLQCQRRINWNRGTYSIERKGLLDAIFSIYAGLEMNDDIFVYKLNFQYHGEEGEGSGVTKDIYGHFFEELKKHGLLLQLKGGDYFFSTCQICKCCRYHNATHYQLLGQIMAKMFFDEIPMPIPISVIWSRLIFDKPILLNDLKSWDLEFYRMIYRYHHEPHIETFDLKWNGSLVTKHNLQAFLHSKIQHEIWSKFSHSSFLHLKSGFLQFTILNKLTQILSVTQFHRLFVGKSPEKVDPELFKWIPPLSLTHPLVQFFLKWLKSISFPRFLSWSTGSPRIPWNSKPIQISFNEDLLYPTAQTCFNHVYLPNLSSFDDFCLKMNEALLQTSFLLR